jgi:predicted acyl esterase
MTGQYEMLLEQNADVRVRDGAILHANVYRPNANGRFPVLMTFGPYGKDVPLREFMQEAWDRLNKTYLEILAASSCKHLVFERPDPEMWVPDGYVVINVDSRGAGKSPGRLDPNSPAEFRDFYDAIVLGLLAGTLLPSLIAWWLSCSADYRKARSRSQKTSKGVSGHLRRRARGDGGG